VQEHVEGTTTCAGHSLPHHSICKLSIYVILHQEILSVVMTHGPKHSELEYIHLFGLLARSRPALEAAEFHAKLGRLKDLVRQFCF